MIGRPPVDPALRFAAFLRIGETPTHRPELGPCIVWTGRPSYRGYGRFRLTDRTVLAHRFAWTMSFGEPPKDLFVCHACDNPLCCRIDHLFLGTSSDNQRDMTLKGRGRFGNRNGRWIDGRSLKRKAA